VATKLNGKQIEALTNVLAESFPRIDQLERVVKFGLNTDLEAISDNQNLVDACFDLAQWANSQGLVSELLDAAFEQNPRNTELKDVRNSINMSNDSYKDENQDSDSIKKRQPKFEINLPWFKIMELEPISFITGILTGVVLLIGAFNVLPKEFQQGLLGTNVHILKQHIKIFEHSNNTPETLEGSHYKLQPEKEYRIEIVNPELGEHLVWKLVPDDFGEINFNADLVSEKKLFAVYTPPIVPDGSSGFIEVCEVDESNLCHRLKLPEIKVVISR